MKIASTIVISLATAAALAIVGFVLWVEYQAFIGANPFQ